MNTRQSEVYNVHIPRRSAPFRFKWQAFTGVVVTADCHSRRMTPHHVRPPGVPALLFFRMCKARPEIVYAAQKEIVLIQSEFSSKCSRSRAEFPSTGPLRREPYTAMARLRAHYRQVSGPSLLPVHRAVAFQTCLNSLYCPIRFGPSGILLRAGAAFRSPLDARA